MRAPSRDSGPLSLRHLGPLWAVTIAVTSLASACRAGPGSPDPGIHVPFELGSSRGHTANDPPARPRARTGPARPSREPPGAPRAGQLRVRFFAAGHGLAVLFQTPSGHAVLVDAGRGDRALLGDNLVRRRIVPHLRQQGITSLSAWLITHPHFDHFGDPESLGRAVRIERVLLNADGELWLGHKLSEELGDVPREVLHRGHRLTFGRLTLKVLNPAASASPADRTWGIDQHNNRSLVVQASFGQVRFLLTGDLLRRGELRLLRRLRAVPGGLHDLRADVLQLGHHGLGSGRPRFLRRVRPRFAVASCGDKWRGRDRLRPRLLHNLERHDIELLRTDRQGDIVFTTDGDELHVDTQPEHIHRPARPARGTQILRRRWFQSQRLRRTYGLEVPRRGTKLAAR